MPITDDNELYALVGEVMVLSARVEASLESCIASDYFACRVFPAGGAFGGRFFT